MNIRALAIASTTAGVVMGLLSNMPVIYLFNCLLFGWVWASAILGAWIYQRNSETVPAITPSQGTVIGIISGIIGLITFAVLYPIFSTFFFAPAANSANAELEGALFTGFLGITWGVYLLIGLFAFPLFGAVGGAIGGTLFKHE